MNRIHLAAVAFLAAWVLSVHVPAAADRGLALALQLQQGPARLGAPYRFVARAVNISEQPLRVDLRRGAFAAVVEGRHGVVWEWRPHASARRPGSEVLLQPGQALGFAASWIPDRTVRPGVYRLRLVQEDPGGVLKENSGQAELVVVLLLAFLIRQQEGT